MKRALCLGGVILLTMTAIHSQEMYTLTVNVNTSDGLGQLIWSNTYERTLTSDESETFLFEASNGSLTISVSLHAIDDEELLLVAGSNFELNQGESGPIISANLKSISLKKGEKVVYYPLGKNEDNEEGGMLFSMELVVNPVENENI